jgi:4-amino-4-deoxy-L-arabinose transferase-like glycosyltransferase
VTTEFAQRPAGPWWRTWDVPALIVLVVAAYFVRAAELPLRGEEPTRAQIAFEMVYWHDWLIPRVQGEPLGIRPPLQNWINAGCCVAVDSWGVYAIRLPSVLATLLTTLLIYGYARLGLGRVGAFGAAVAFATMADMFKMGLYAETEPLFILLVSASLMLWHWGILHAWPDWVTFTVGYGIMALATLTKGIQAPPYFVGGIGLYLVVTWQWRRLVSPAHLLGVLVCVAIVAAWVVPYGMTLGWPAAMRVWLGDQTVVNSRHVWEWNLAETGTHLATYPLEVAAASLPWCLLLLPYLHAAFRRTLGTARPQVVFVAIAMAVAWPTCWIPPGGLPRYFAPLFPSMAILIGVVIERCAEAPVGTFLHAAWRRYRLAVGTVMVAAAVAIMGLAAGLSGLSPGLAPLAESPWVAFTYGGVVVGLAMLLLRRRTRSTAARMRVDVMAVALFMVLTITGLATNVRLRRSVDAAGEVEALRAKLPPGAALVSLYGPVDSLFSYYYGLPIITPRHCPPFGNDNAEGVSYFCFVSPGDGRPTLPFAWEEIGAVNLDRNLMPVPERVLVIGRRVQDDVRAERSVPAIPVSRPADTVSAAP